MEFVSGQWRVTSERLARGDVWPCDYLRIYFTAVTSLTSPPS
jgi:hypothetical protein